MIRNWKPYVKDNIIMKDGLQVRGYISGDNIDNFVENGVILANTVRSEVEIDSFNGLRILDVGCANGRLPIALDYLGQDIASYTGLDVMPLPIAFCKEAFAESRKHKFIHLDINNQRYAPFQSGGVNTGLQKGQYDLVVCNSLFTHLGLPTNANTYLQKIVDATDNDEAVFYITWFRSPPNTVSHFAKRTVYLESTIRDFYKKAGLNIIKEFGGNTTSNNNQWHIIAKKELNE